MAFEMSAVLNLDGNFIAQIQKNIEAAQQMSDSLRRATVNMDEFQSGNYKAAEAAQKFSDTVKTPLPNNLFKSMTKEVSNMNSVMGSHLESIKNKIFNMKNLLATVVAGAGTKKLFDFTVGGSAEFEAYQNSFEVMLGSADQAKAKMKELSDYANNTPFELPEVVQAGRTLMTFGLDTEKWIQNAGNLASAMNANVVDVARAMGNINSGNFGEAFERLRDFGISKQMLEAQGLKFDKSGSYVGSVEQAMTAVDTIVNSKFGGMTAKQATSFNGLKSTFSDSISAIGRQIGDIAFPKAKDALIGLMNTVNQLSENGSIQSFAEKVGTAIGKIADAIPKVIQGIISFGTMCSQHSTAIQAAFVAIGAGWLAMQGVMIATTIVGQITKVKAAIVGLQGMAKANAIFTTLFGFGPQALIFVAAIMAIATVAFLIYKYWEPIKAWFAGFWEGTKAVFNAFWTWLVSFFSKWGTTILAVLVPFIGVPLFIYQHWGEIKAKLEAIWIGIQVGAMNIFNSVAAFLIGIWEKVKAGILIALTPLINTVLMLFNNVKSGLANILNGVAAVFSGAWNLIKTVVLGAILLIIDIVTGNFSKLKSDASKIMQSIGQSITQIWNGIKQYLTGVVQVIWGVIKTYFTLAWTGIVTIWTTVSTFLSGLWNGLVSLCTQAWNGMSSAISSILSSIWAFITSVWNGILNFFRTLPSTLMNLGTQMFTSLWNGANSILASISSWIIQAFNSAISFLTSLPSKAMEWGRDFIDGLANGIKSKVNDIVDSVKGIGDTIRSYLHFSVPDVGPLTDYETWMPDFLQGMGKGIKVNTHLVTEPIKELAVGVKTNMGKSLESGKNSAGTGSTKTVINNKNKDRPSITIAKLADSIVVREEADIDKIATKLAHKLEHTDLGMA